MHVGILEDTRESHVHNALVAEAQRVNMYMERKEITTGDYIIFAPTTTVEGVTYNRALAMIERKSHADFADSLCDGRILKGIENMKNFRAKTGCQVWIVMEGPLADTSTPFKHVQYGSLLTAAFRMSIADGFFIVHTRDTAQTARHIVEIALSYDTLLTNSSKTRPPDAGGEGLGQISLTAARPFDPNEALVPYDLMALATERHELPIETQRANLWAAISGISPAIGAVIDTHFSVSALVSGEVNGEQIRALRGASGRALNKQVYNVLIALSGLRTRQQPFPEYLEKAQRAIVLAVPGVGRNIGNAILDDVGKNLYTLVERLRVPDATIVVKGKKLTAIMATMRTVFGVA